MDRDSRLGWVGSKFKDQVSGKMSWVQLIFSNKAAMDEASKLLGKKNMLHQKREDPLKFGDVYYVALDFNEGASSGKVLNVLRHVMDENTISTFKQDNEPVL